FSAVVWTQLGKKLTPEMEGWAIEYDASFQLVAVRPTIELAGILDRLNLEFQRFRKIYMDMMRLYREGQAIRMHYLNAVEELTASKALVQHVTAEQKLHSYMVPDHLESQIQGFQAEALFWQFRVSDELLGLVKEFREFVATKPEKSEEFMQSLELTEEEIAEFYACMDLYSDIEGGYRRALKLYEKALDNTKIDKERQLIEKRFGTIETLIYA
ncbi:MAG: hypothetical protein Q6361_03725, partial [Candidatus Hermodarchaeota archaeon]|nr:hypothetical protein [Candidatus Hermodarchaeota archaeon]